MLLALAIFPELSGASMGDMWRESESESERGQREQERGERRESEGEGSEEGFVFVIPILHFLQLFIYMRFTTIEILYYLTTIELLLLYET